MKTFTDWQGRQQSAPVERGTRVAAYGADDVITWSRGSGIHRINYGLQTKNFTDDVRAAKEFGLCVRHYAECEGLLIDE